MIRNHIFYLDCWLSNNIWKLGGNLVLLLVNLSWHLCFSISGREALLWSDFCDKLDISTV